MMFTISWLMLPTGWKDGAWAIAAPAMKINANFHIAPPFVLCSLT